MTTTVYMLWFVQEQEDDEDVELLIGVSETEEQARAAIDKRKDKPGFIDFPEGFQIHPTRLGEEGWTVGS